MSIVGSIGKRWNLTTLGRMAHGSDSFTEFRGNIEAGYKFSFNQINLTPYVGGDLRNQNLAGFTETGRAGTRRHVMRLTLR